MQALFIRVPFGGAGLLFGIKGSGLVVPPFAVYDPLNLVRALNVRKGHTFSLLDKSMKFGTDDLHAILFQNFDGSNLRC